MVLVKEGINTGVSTGNPYFDSENKSSKTIDLKQSHKGMKPYAHHG
jgi:hypothetical protein